MRGALVAAIASVAISGSAKAQSFPLFLACRYEFTVSEGSQITSAKVAPSPSIVMIAPNDFREWDGRAALWQRNLCLTGTCTITETGFSYVGAPNPAGINILNIARNTGAYERAISLFGISTRSDGLCEPTSDPSVGVRRKF